MSDATRSFDVLVIGGGPGGYVAAIRASQLGLSAACVERAELGGVCLNWGCIPSKALLHTGTLRRQMADAKKIGLRVSGVEVDWGKVIGHSRKVARRLNKGVASLFAKYGVTHIAGEARLDRPGRVVVADAEGAEEILDAAHIIVATGARPRPLPGTPFDGERVLSSREAMILGEQPGRLLVIGAGAIGCEFAYFYNAMGTEVVLVEMADRLVPVEDEEVSEALRASLVRQGIEIHTSTVASDIQVGAQGVSAALRAADAAEGDAATTIDGVDRVLVAIGVMGNVEGLGLEACGVEVQRGAIVVDEDLRTTCRGIYALGDCAGPPWLAHKASAEGLHCVERIAGHAGRPVAYDNIPGCTYCEPQIASVGLSEAKAREGGRAVKVGRFPFAASGKALAASASEGFVKVVFDAETGELLGAHLIGHGVTELIGELTLGRTMEVSEAEILGTIHAHPTLSEAIHEAVGQAFGEGVNL